MSKYSFSKIVCVVVFLLGTSFANADVIIYDTLPASGGLDLSSQAGQTFTTPNVATLGVSTKLKSITVAGPNAGSGSGDFTYGLQLFVDADQNPFTWGMGSILTVTDVRTIGVGQTETWNLQSLNLHLNYETVYGLRFVNASGNPVDVRVGTGSGLGTGGGALFTNGSTHLSGTDLAAQITMVPEPGTAGLLLIGVVGLIATRRRAH